MGKTSVGKTAIAWNDLPLVDAVLNKVLHARW
jgi:hypothetical protein